MVLKLMIVDDSNIIRSKITRTLTQHNMEVVATASNGEDAVKLFAESKPDVVTMDLTMPRMDGIECIRALRKLNSAVHILVVSALADKSTAIQALKEGVFAGCRCPRARSGRSTERSGRRHGVLGC